jgi:gamma-glutamyltranspeptidase/glutathione hydrolase
MRVLLRFLASLAVAALAAAPARAYDEAGQAAPEIASGIVAKPLVRAKSWMAVTANPHASEAAAEILRAGGGAVDAAIAAQLVLGLVEPQSSGLGGGGFALHWSAAERSLTTFDGRETAPAAATPSLFETASDGPMGFMDAVIGGRSVGVPGTPRLLEHMHRRRGKLPWARLFEPALRLAEGGFAVSSRLAAQIAGDAGRLARDPEAATYFMPGGAPLKAGDRLTNPSYAQTLKGLRDGGADAFYSGPIADAIVAKLRDPGLMATADLAGYRTVERPAVCGPYRAYLVCGMGPPSSGGIAVAQILGMLEPSDLAALGPASPEAWRLIGDASRLAFADRARYVADPAFAPQPVEGLIARDYIASRAQLLAGGRALREAPAGTPRRSHTRRFAPDESLEIPGTTHLSIVDASGDVVSMTSSIEAGFGSRLLVRGFLLNNELTDFSFRSERDGVPVANRVEPGKRPRSTMAPTIVLKDGQPMLAIGSPGGSQIVGYVVKALVAHLDWGMDVAEATALPNMLNRYGPFELERGTPAETLAPPLQALGYATEATDLTSGLHAIAITPEGLEGGADPRREGAAVGE